MASLSRFKRVFNAVRKRPVIIGMIHVLPLPGTPRYRNGSIEHILTTACMEAEILATAGVDGIMIENMHDVPYLNREVGPEITANMAVISLSIKKIVGSIPCGLQILAGCNKEALAVAKAAGSSFIRCEGFVFGHMADEGFMNADAGSLLRYRRSIDAEDVLVLTDVKKKHSSHAITDDLDVLEFAQAAQFFLSDGVIVTGQHTGLEADTGEVKQLKKGTDLPVLVGSGVTETNVTSYLGADGMIIGSHFKKNGLWENPMCKERVQSFMNHFRNVAAINS